MFPFRFSFLKEMIEPSQPRPKNEILSRLTDAHCHSNDAYGGKDLVRAAKQIGQLAIGKVCVMSSSLESQLKTEELFGLEPDKVVPAFGLHPWFAGSLSAMTGESDQGIDKRTHYREILTTKNSANKLKKKKEEEEERLENDQEEVHQWIDSHLHLLPNPIRLKDFLAQLRITLRRLPTSIVGEIGMDKVFTFHLQQPPSSAISPATQSNCAEKRTDAEDRETPPVAKTRYKVSIDHQLEILRAQIELAIEICRPISLHCVQAPTEMLGLVDELIARWGVRFTGLPGTRRTSKGKFKMRETVREDATVQEDSAGDAGTGHQGINLCWHSPNLSVEVLQQILRKLPQTAYFSYSNDLAVLHESRPLSKTHSGSVEAHEGASLEELYSPRVLRAIQATPIDRLLIETDHGADPAMIDEKLLKIFCLIRRAKTSPSSSCSPPSSVNPLDSEAQCLAAQIEANWNRFYAGA